MLEGPGACCVPSASMSSGSFELDMILRVAILGVGVVVVVSRGL
jgi:hypothetical protein